MKNSQAAIQDLYTVFKPYKVLGNIRNRSCDCCVTDNEIKELLSKPLKELEAKDLSSFITSAITTFGDIEDYKHFLPRILELMQLQKIDIDDFIIYEKLNYSNWKTWNENEIDTINNYFLALWKIAISNKEAVFYDIKNILGLVSKPCRHHDLVVIL